MTNLAGIQRWEPASDGLGTTPGGRMRKWEDGLFILCSDAEKIVGQTVKELQSQLDTERLNVHRLNDECDHLQARAEKADEALDRERQLNESAMHKETAMCLELEREKKEVVYLEGLVEEERRIGDWMVENQAVIHGYIDTLFWHPFVNPDTSTDRTTKFRPIIKGDWRKAVLEVMDE